MTAVPEGFLDSVRGVVTGWAWLPVDPGRRLRVEVLFASADGDLDFSKSALPVEAVAGQLRADLAVAGKGDGCYGFTVPVPALFAGREHRVDVRLLDFPEARLLGAPRTAIIVLAPAILRALEPNRDDLDRLCVFLAETVRLNGGTAATAVPDAAKIHGWVAASDRCWLIAERKGRIVGQCRVGPEWPAEPGTGALALGIELHPDVRGFGLGPELMMAAYRWAAGRCARMELAVLPHNARALRLYRALGYADLGPVPFPGTGEIHRRMAIPLPPYRPFGGVTLLV